ncbi:HTH-type transcriptional regulator ArgP [Burkholderia vietnamiensis]|jgi:LysR family transcriptional regulator (chromosome initiation inhibitor)|uniref:Transcriptional regulator, LysR family n=2 Tax=Burkholderia vietnamiensis TaxID=60552 RepID=A4JK32_BURVG|nr:HTH-type transcriptional regulator ArgP [Burkholderia vietnamiensis]ABO56635.1 transcriptional regulator, LysR family [Burkholderia vietnamiensis G4]AJY03988.1 transcriptional regulator, ArgP family protein [Burkholderia vietnamiensis LMG 10929]AOK44173.1 chromosome replication initiation inhibitor protein [Burkholderia vietnamiensis]AVR13103.1 ArgP/LysG family DNA-binding transcriptional regulator [Burkholderia vietnamiensis]KVE66685.1 chromosome replication initiation inhibitor protein [B
MSLTIDPKQAAALLAVADTGSFEQAAVRLHVTASAVTQRVRALEASLGTPLVLRTRPCRPTIAGQRVLQHLRRVALLQADLQSTLAAERASPISVTIALNSDSLGTWFLPALTSVLAGERILFELIVEDQDHTFALLESGMAVGCVTTESKPMRGCVATPLGTMRYRLLAAAAFAARWFPRGLNRASARAAPVVAYSRRDTLQSTFLREKLGLPDGAYPCHYVPGTHAHFAAVRHALGYAMVPEPLLGDVPLDAQGLVDLAHAHPTDITLYWHAWTVQSPTMASLSARVVEAARRLLAPLAD